MFAPTEYLRWARRYYGQTRYDLATSGMPTVPLEEVIDAERAAPGDPAAAEARLRAMIAHYNDVPEEEVLPALGTTHAIWLACAAVLSHGDDVVVEAPVYEPLVRIPESFGARAVAFRREAADGYALDAGAVARAVTPRTRLVIVSNLHNPTGVRARDEDLRAVARVAASAGARLLVDEVYAPFDALVDDRAVFAGSARKLGEDVIAVSSLTKCFGLGPDRIGWVLAPPEVIARAEDAVIGSAGLLPYAHARAAIGRMAVLPALAERSRRLLAGKRERVAAWVAARGLTWSAPDAGLFGLVTVPGRGDLTPAIEAAAKAGRVLVGPGKFFGVEGAFRLGWSLPAEDLDEALTRLAAALNL
jgi:aspartate/methionine/tyrosine aminotransferase